MKLPPRPERAPATQVPTTREQVRAADLKSTLSYNKAFITDAMVASEFRIAQLPQTQEVERRFELAKQEWIRNNPDRVKANPALVEEGGPLVWWIIDTKHDSLDLIRAGHLKMPTAIIWGWNDSFAPYPFGLGAMDIISKANDRTEMHFVNHAGHFVFAEQPVEVTRLINNFIEAQQALPR